MQDGGRQILTFTGSTSPLMQSTRRWRIDCAADRLGVVAYSPEGVRYDMRQKVKLDNGVVGWYTTKITDRNGNYAVVSYATPDSFEITRVDTNDGRWVTFTYLDAGTSTRRISRISASGNRYVDYAYQAVPNYFGSYQLKSVTRPDGRAWNYDYNEAMYAPSGGAWAMKTVTTPEGGVTNYEYTWTEFDRLVVSTGVTKITYNSAVTKKVVNASGPGYSSAGGTWLFSYTPGTTAGVYDTTKMTAPDGTVTTYKHYGPRYTSNGNGTVWMVGLLMSKDIGGKQQETYTWSKQRISGEKYYRLGAYDYLRYDTETASPVLSQKTITRDGANYTTTYSNFDAYDNPGLVTESGPNGGNRTTTLTYNVDTSKWLIKQVKDESFTGSSVTRSFDTNGNLLSLTRDGVSTSYTYDSQGNVATVTYPRSLTHTLSNYKRGIPQNEAQPEGVNITRVVDDAGNVTSETNGDQRTTTYGYDLLNRLASITYPAGDPVSISYSPSWDVMKKTVTRGTLVETTTYDGFLRPASVTLGGITRNFYYDSNGRKSFASNPDATIGTTYKYDALGRATLITNADNTSRNIAYGAGTRTVTDERGNATTDTFRAYGNPEQTFVMGIATPGASANITLARNSKDLVTSVTQAGSTRTYGYNGNYYLTSVVDPETGTTTYGRDAAGNMTTRSVGGSGTTTYTYDNQNRLTNVVYPNGTPAVSKTYSKTHRLLTVNSSVANRSYDYDLNNNLKTETLVVDGRTFAIGYGYNSRDQLQSITYPQSGSLVSFVPDALGRPTQVSGYVTSVSYWPSGQTKQINYANGTVTAYGQNSRLWPSAFSTQKTGVYYINSSYGYDGVGNLTSITDSVQPTLKRSFGYDNLDRLTTANADNMWGNGTIVYNGAGNITSQVLGSFNLYYNYTDGTNRLNGVSGSRTATYGYDAYGNVTSGAGNTYTYDGVPNLTCVNCGNAAAMTAYTYDGLNHRVSVTKAGVKTYEVYDSNGRQLIEFTPGKANGLIQYIYLGGKRIAQRTSS